MTGTWYTRWADKEETNHDEEEERKKLEKRRKTEEEVGFTYNPMYNGFIYGLLY